MSCCTKKLPCSGGSHIHPLQPLTESEILESVEIIQHHPLYNKTSIRLVSITLLEPDKRSIYESIHKNTPIVTRGAVVTMIDSSLNQAYTSSISITDKKILTFLAAPAGSQPTITCDEMAECEAAVIGDLQFKALIKKHYGIEDTSLVMVDIWSAGYYGVEEERTRRLSRPLCFMRRDPLENGYPHPIEGIRPVVDLNTMEVIRVEEYGVWELPPRSFNYSTQTMTNFRSNLKPLEITQPEGASFTLTDNFIEWQNWSMVIGFNSREGLTLHDIRYTDMGIARPIIFRASLSEMVVPYGDPSLQQVRKNAFDVGEYGIHILQ
jgi:primary-amine oxidase